MKSHFDSEGTLLGDVSFVLVVIVSFLVSPAHTQTQVTGGSSSSSSINPGGAELLVTVLIPTCSLNVDVTEVQPDSYKSELLPADVPKMSVEAWCIPLRHCVLQVVFTLRGCLHCRLGWVRGALNGKMFVLFGKSVIYLVNKISIIFTIMIIRYCPNMAYVDHHGKTYGKTHQIHNSPSSRHRATFGVLALGWKSRS